MAAIHDLNVDQGSDFSVQLKLLDADDAPLDLTDCVARMQLRKFYRGPVALSLSSPDGGLEITPAEGAISVTITHEQSTGIAAGIYLYDLEVTFPDETVWRVIEGKVNNRPEVTRLEATNG